MTELFYCKFNSRLKQSDKLRVLLFKKNIVMEKNKVIKWLKSEEGYMTGSGGGAVEGWGVGEVVEGWGGL